MSVPREFLKCSSLVDGSAEPMLITVLSALNAIVADELSVDYELPSSPMSPESVDMDFTIFSDAADINTSNTPNRKPFIDVRLADDRNGDSSVIKLAAKMCIGYLHNHLGHFPRQFLGAARLNAYVSENDDHPHIAKCEASDELNADIFNAPNVLFFVVNQSSIVSFTEIFCNNENVRDNYLFAEKKVRVIMRDLIGKFAWDCAQIAPLKVDNALHQSIIGSRNMKGNSNSVADEYENDEPTIPQEDMLESIMKFITKTSPECISNKSRNGKSVSNPHSSRAEENMIALLLNQHYQEMNFMEQYSESKDRVIVRNGSEPDFRASKGHFSSDALIPSYFQNCRQLLDQLGFLSWEKRTKIELLSKSDKVLRELRNLDKQNCRETHKIAVIYVAEGQEDKNSILLNTSGSKAFETFVAGLGWEVDLKHHLGFRGGLQKNKSTGNSTPYYATTFLEVIFHVSTRIPATMEDTDSVTKKLRHLGNDEIHIVWSEHWRDYRHDIIPTEFGDVLIVIYPVPSFADYYRIHITRKPEVPFFGPLYTGSIVHISVLAGLVRSTAINASRSQRQTVPYYQNFFEERSRCIETIAGNQDTKCFEEYAATAYSPIQLGLLTSRPVSSLSNVTASGGETQSLTSIQSNIADPSPSPRLRNRPISTGTALLDSRPTSIRNMRPASAFPPASTHATLTLPP